jgi:hypothetical protein
VAWTALGPETGGSRGSLDILAQRYNAQGARLGTQLSITGARPATQENVSLAFVGAGRYVAVFEDESETGADTLGTAVHGQLMLTTGPRSGFPFLIPTRRAFDQHQPAVASFPNGRFVVVWTDDSGSADDPNTSAIRGQLYASNGTKIGGEFRVNARISGNQSEPAVATFANNVDFVVVWTDTSFGQPPDTQQSGIRGQVFRITP